jgi:[ribosomal protein S5]-alanine N-acetyltransferase
MILESQRLYLREINLYDLDDLLKIWGDPDTLQYFPFVLDRDEMLAWIDRNQKRYDKYGHGLWGVTRKEDGKFIGDCGLIVQEIEGIKELEVGYHFNKDYWGKGYARESAKACIDYALNRLDRSRVISLVRPENLPSRKVAEANEMVVEREIIWKELRHLVYVVEKSENNYTEGVDLARELRSKVKKSSSVIELRDLGRKH